MKAINAYFTDKEFFMLRRDKSILEQREGHKISWREYILTMIEI